MRKKTLYFETSLFGFLFDERPENIEKREAVEQLLSQVGRELFVGVVSPLVTRELNRAGLDYLVGKHGLEIVRVPEEEMEELAEEYIKAGVLRTQEIEDARHVAAATILEADVLVSLNLKHIVNTWRIQGFNGLNLRLGYRTINVATPQEVLLDVG